MQPVTAYYLGTAFPKHAWLKKIFILQERGVLKEVPFKYQCAEWLLNCKTANFLLLAEQK